MYFPSIDDERTTLRNYLKVQLEAVRDAGYGLSDEQLVAQPTASKLSLAGLLKHCLWVMTQALVGAGAMTPEESPVATQDPATDFYASFALTDSETVSSIKEAYEALMQRYLEMIGSLDMDAEITSAPQPWYGINEPHTVAVRYLVAHHLEEFARHAGHADIIREQIDGAQAAELNAAVEGREANEYVTPWTPHNPSIIME